MSPPPAGTGRSLDWGGALTRVGEGAEDDVARVVDGHGDAVAEDLAHLRQGIEGEEPRVGRLVVTRSAVTCGSSPGSTMPVTGVHAPLSDRLTSSTSSAPSTPGRSTTAVTPGIQSSSVPTMVRRWET